MVVKAQRSLQKTTNPQVNTATIMDVKAQGNIQVTTSSQVYTAR